MHSLRGWNWLALGGLVGLVHSAALPVITPAPQPDRVGIRSLKYRQDPDAIEILQVLITALPLSLRQIAATNIPAVSSILWEEFLDDNRPDWFNELPYDIQSYFIQEFGPATAAPPASEALPTDVTASATEDRGLSVENFEHRRPLNPAAQQKSRFVEDMNWEDDGYDPAPMSTAYQGHTIPPAAGVSHPNQGYSMPAESTPITMQDNHTPILAPALYHSHSSNRARGRRTSYTSLHSVAEVTEPDDEMNGESPILGRHNSPPKTGPRRPGMSALDTLPVAAVASIKRKPVPTSPISSPAAEASRGLLRPSLAQNTADHSGSSSSGLAVSSMSSNSGHVYHSDDSAPISPITHQKTSSNPFAGGYSYLEDYGPEYSNDGYNDQDDELYGGHRTLDRYPDPNPPMRKSSKTEWPLRNVMGGGGQKRTRSPMWDRVYERV
ncbi:unnamed protein product [Alternaria sp. RS040]